MQNILEILKMWQLFSWSRSTNKLCNLVSIHFFILKAGRSVSKTIRFRPLISSVNSHQHAWFTLMFWEEIIFWSLMITRLKDGTMLKYFQDHIDYRIYKQYFFSSQQNIIARNLCILIESSKLHLVKSTIAKI